MPPVPARTPPRRSVVSHTTAPPPSLPLRHPALLAAAAVAALCLLASVTFRIADPDLWQHLAVGKALWTTHALPRTNVWTWPTYGEAQVLPSWGFRVLLWPFWALGGERGLLAWRWLTTLGAFGLLWAAARRMGARGFSALAVMVLCALIFRKRSEMRPETLVAILLALEIWILEARRCGGPDRSPWLVAIACAWVNVHISWPIGLAVLGFHAFDDLITNAPGPSGAPRPLAVRSRLVWVGLAAVAASFLNPFGWSAVWQPFDFVLHERHESIFRGIAELQPVQWEHNLTNGLPLLVAAWPLLALARARRLGIDWAEALTLAFFLSIGLSSQRFIGFLALAAAPYVARDLAALLDVAGAAAPRAAAWLAPPAVRATLVAVACVAGSIPDWAAAQTTFGLSLDLSQTPVGACDFIARHGIRGRGFSPFHFGGYVLWRFWPDPGRLPFMDIHQTGTREDRALSVAAFASRPAYRQLVARHGFDYAIVDRQTPFQYRLLDFFDEDSTWSLVFVDDAAALYLRRTGATAAVADSFRYRAWPAGYSNIGEVYQRYRADPSVRAEVDRELARQVESSPWNAMAHNYRANLALLSNRPTDAERELRAALAVSPRVLTAHERLGLIALQQGRARDALHEFMLERRDDPRTTRLEMAIAEAWRELGDFGRARAWYRREIERQPDNRIARDSLAALEGRR
jgi:tetratricopeptide (TPR) repeat protein